MPSTVTFCSMTKSAFCSQAPLAFVHVSTSLFTTSAGALVSMVFPSAIKATVTMMSSPLCLIAEIVPVHEETTVVQRRL